MIRAIVRSSLRFRLLVVAIAVGVMGVGIAQLRDAPADTLPEFTPPYVEIQTEALGLSADEVEQLITVPMEADLLNGVQDVDVLRSQSAPGLSSIVMVFDDEADLYTSRQLVQERLAQTGAAALPNVSKPPVMLQPYSSSSRVLMFGLASDRISPIEQSVIARWTVQPRLLGVPGVANVSIWGFRDRQLQVLVDPEHLRDRGVTLSQVVESTANAQVASPLSFVEGSTPGTGGFIETPQQRLGVRNVFDSLTRPSELGKVPVQDTGNRLRLRDVANVVEDHQPLSGDAVVNGGAGLMLVVEKFPGANTREVTEGVEAALEDLRPGLGGMRPDTSVFRPATFIEDAIGNLTLALIIGGALLALAIAAFLFQWRTVLVSLFTIPLALIAAALVLEEMGQSFNAISFAGLAVALAFVVDDAVAGTENVMRRLRRQREAGSDRPTADIVREATHEIRSPLMYATLIALLAIVPVAVMAGRPGAFLEPLALAYALAVVAAAVVALTVTPALSLLLFSRGGPGRESPVMGALVPRYGRAVAGVVGRPRAVMLAAGGAVVVALAVLPLMGTSLIPAFKDRDVLVRLNADPGTSNTKMTALARKVSRDVGALPGIDNVGAHVGRAVNGDRVVDVNSGDVWVSIDSGADYNKTIASIEDTVARTPGVRANVVTYSGQRIRDVGALREGDNSVTGDGLDVLTGTDRPLTVRVFGEDLAVLRREAAKVRGLMAGVDGVVDPRVEQIPVQPNAEIEVDLDKARQAGIKPGDVRRAQATLVNGLHVGDVFEKQKVFEVVVQGTPNTRRNVDDIRNLLLDAPGGRHVRLGQVADVRVANRPIVINRDQVSRRLDVKADVSGRSLDAVADDIGERLQSSSFPLEYHAEVVKRTTGEEIDGGQVLAWAIAAAIGSLLLLQAAFRSWRLGVLAFLTVPVAMAGGVLAALIAGGDVTLGSLIGFLALVGIAARNALVLIRHFQELEHYEGEPFGPGLVARGGSEKLTPVLTTATALGLMSLVFVVLGSRPGLEVVHPMAVVILGGLVTTTLVTLFAIPALYLRFGDRQAPLSPEEELIERWVGMEPGRAPARTPAPAPAPDAGTTARAEDARA